MNNDELLAVSDGQGGLKYVAKPLTERLRLRLAKRFPHARSTAAAVLLLAICGLLAGAVLAGFFYVLATANTQIILTMLGVMLLVILLNQKPSH